jgi:hypothetical protein
MWTILAAKQAMTGFAASKAAESAPTMQSSVPASASFGVRLSGASTKAMPAACSSSASSPVETGSDVEESITIRPGRAPARMPSGPRTSASTCGLPVTQSTMISASAAMARGLATSRAPRPTRSSTGARLRCAMTRSGNPLARMFLAMPWPIRPSPMKPTVLFAMPESPACVAAAENAGCSVGSYAGELRR